MKMFLMGVLTMGAAFADVVTDWNAVMRATVSAEGPQAQAPIPCGANVDDTITASNQGSYSST